MTTPIGIDLGTTNCCVAYLDQGEVRVLEIDGRNTMPSIIAQEADGTFLIGSDATRCVEPTFRYGFVKRHMGVAQPFTFRDGPLSPVQISAKYLAKLKEHAQEALHGPVSAVITVPAHFGEIHVKETRNAAELAGLEVLDIIREPEAAAIAYHQECHPDSAGSPTCVLVYDLGGGTMDATVCIRDGDDIRIGGDGAANAGDKFLGGFDFDKQILSLVMPSLHKQGVDLSAGIADPVVDGSVPVAIESSWYELVRYAERVKMRLSDDPKTKWVQELYFGYSQVRIDQWITRAEFEAAGAPLLAQTIETCKGALDRLGECRAGANALTREERIRREAGALDALILVGGSTRMPAVERELQQWLTGLRDTPLRIERFREDECVAIGAAFVAAQRLRQRDTPIPQGNFRLVWDVQPSVQVPPEVGDIPGPSGKVDGPLGPGWSLRLHAGDTAAEVGLDKEGRFMLPRLGLKSGENRFTLTLGAPDGAMHSSWGWAVRRGGLSTDVSGLPCAIKVRLLDGEVTILPTGTKPDTAHSHIFYIRKLCRQADKLVFRLPLYEGYRAIGTLEVEADALPGTPVLIRATYKQPGALGITAGVGEKSPQELPFRFAEVDVLQAAGELQERFHLLKEKIDQAFANLSADPAYVAYLRARWDSLCLDLHTEFEGRMVVDKAKIQDRMARAEELRWQLDLLGNSAESLRQRCVTIVELMRKAGVNDERLRGQADKITARLDGEPTADVLASVAQDLEELRRSVYSRMELYATDQHVVAKQEEIRHRLATIRAVYGNDEYARLNLPQVEQVIASIPTTLHTPNERLNRLWAIDDQYIREPYHQAVLSRDRDGLLAQSA